ncbi:TPA: helix-turn-helix domain-containing protein, partial [Enterococcus faecium]
MLVKKYRKQKKLTQKEVAQKIGINERQYQRIEAGESFA